MRCTLPIPALVLLASAALAPPAAAQVPPPPGKPVTIDATLSGQPIRAPEGALRVVITQTVIPAGGRLPVHKHPYPRVVNLLAGRLKITNLDTGEAREAVAGDWMVDAVDQWHEAQVIGDEPARLMTVDQAPPGATVTIPRFP
ncbi:MAG: cupin domain-containing protein [Phenylobacterium sp.]|uniref:cupin domain-containing protein n=1 Tax=Phenylobacterium sp. TaxID=1871053 RepID=UPI001222A2BC|nr:cupin domain-containing protein [Phenylobacterium sp.]TAJ70986.1 MAG: cupin domain-containing protein [Phenylobacterium sp.]